MRTVHVVEPIKTETSYVFDIYVAGKLSRFGFHSHSPIAHGKIWDSLFPLLHLTRNGSLLYREKQECRIRFDYPVHERIASFFVERCRDAWGYKLHVDAPSTYDRPRRNGNLSDSVLCLGGGKDSRCLLGLLSRAEKKPQRIVHMGKHPPEHAGKVELFSGHAGHLSERIAPALMMVPHKLYLGSSLGEVHHVHPWHFHYDLAAPKARAQLSSLLHSVGIPTTIEAPINALPYSLVQRFLLEQFPRLAQGQRSSLPQFPSFKNLQVAMLWLHAGHEPWSFCCKELFRKLIRRWVWYRTVADTKTHHNEEVISRYVIDREMMALAWRLRDLDVMADVRDKIPPRWESDHIDYVHDYIDPNIDPDVLRLMLSWAPSFSKAPPGTYRVRS